MKTILKDDFLILVPESSREREVLCGWMNRQADGVFWLKSNRDEGAALQAMGPRAEACNEPLNIWSQCPDVHLRIISNFAQTPFELDDKSYASVEAFWQGLKFHSEGKRRAVAKLHGTPARRAGVDVPYRANVRYQDEEIAVGTWAHWQLMERACWAKFSQHDEARAALLSTGTRPLTHKVRHNSKTIPGTIMAEIWMNIRQQLVNSPKALHGQLAIE